MVARSSKIRTVVVLLAFRLMVGFIVAAWGPFLVLSAHPGKPLAERVPLTVAGAVLIAAGTFGYLWCAWDFASTGLSFSPSLVVESGIYGFLRHPMYFSLVLVLFGDSIFFKSWRLLGCACVFWLIVHIFVVIYEEPHMVKRWGSAYLQHSKRVPRWIPRILRPSTE